MRFLLRAKVYIGKNVKLTLKPNDENTGIVFKRIDIDMNNTIPALADYASDTIREQICHVMEL